jgi:hypothetical protein
MGAAQDVDEMGYVPFRDFRYPHARATSAAKQQYSEALAARLVIDA